MEVCYFTKNKTTSSAKKSFFYINNNYIIKFNYVVINVFFSENRKKTRYYVPAQIIDGEIKPATTH